MARPVTLFTGQWADLSLEELAAKVGEWEFDGLELACWGDHFDVARGAVGLVVHRRAARDPRAQRPQLLGDRQPPRRPGGVRSDRLRVMQGCCRRRCGATETPRACASAPRSG